MSSVQIPRLLCRVLLTLLLVVPAVAHAQAQSTVSPITHVGEKSDLAEREKTASPAIRSRLATLRARIKEQGLNFTVGYTEPLDLNDHAIADLKPPPNLAQLMEAQAQQQAVAPRAPLRSRANFPCVGESKFDWRDHNGVTSVRRQLSCGSCWAFAAHGAFEGSLKIVTGRDIDTSEQDTLDCSGPQNNCNSGILWPFEYLEKIGSAPEAAYVYTGSKAATCQRTTTVPTDVDMARPFRVGHWGYVLRDKPNAVPAPSELKQALCEHGPLAVAMEVGPDPASTNFFLAYTGGVFEEKLDENENAEDGVLHGMTLVGWIGLDDDPDGAWVLKNSWGLAWGEAGYMTIKYNSNRVGTFAAWVDARLDDFILTANDINTIDVRISHGDGSFDPPVEIQLGAGDRDTGVGYVKFAIADFTDDGNLDFVAATDEQPKSNVYLFTRTGQTTFTRSEKPIATLDPDPRPGVQTPDHGLGLTAANLDGKGGIDLLEDTYVAAPNGMWIARGNAYINEGNGTFKRVDDAYNFSDIATGWTLAKSSNLMDVDGDGIPDMLVSEQANGGAVNSKVYLLKGKGDGTFKRRDGTLQSLSTLVFTTNGHPATFMTLGDFNNDGRVDAIVGQDDDGDPGAVFLYLGHGNGTFEQRGIEAFDTRPDIETGSDQPGWGLFQAYDVDHDGILDIVSAVATAGPVAGNTTQATLQFFRGKGGKADEAFFWPKTPVIDSNLVTSNAFVIPPAASSTVKTVKKRTVGGDVNGDERVDDEDVNFVLQLRNRPATGPNNGRWVLDGYGRRLVDSWDVDEVTQYSHSPFIFDPWDLDSDGQITVLDIRKMLVKCPTTRGCQ